MNSLNLFFSFSVKHKTVEFVMHLLLERNLYKNHYVCPFSGISQNREKIKEFILYKCALRAKLFFPNQIYCCCFLPFSLSSPFLQCYSILIFFEETINIKQSFTFKPLLNLYYYYPQTGTGAQFKRRTFHVPSLIAMQVYPNDTSSMADSDVKLHRWISQSRETQITTRK